MNASGVLDDIKNHLGDEKYIQKIKDLFFVENGKYLNRFYRKELDDLLDLMESFKRSGSSELFYDNSLISKLREQLCNKVYITYFECKGRVTLDLNFIKSETKKANSIKDMIKSCIGKTVLVQNSNCNDYCFLELENLVGQDIYNMLYILYYASTIKLSKDCGKIMTIREFARRVSFNGCKSEEHVFTTVLLNTPGLFERFTTFLAQYKAEYYNITTYYGDNIYINVDFYNSYVRIAIPESDKPRFVRNNDESQFIMIKDYAFISVMLGNLFQNIRICKSDNKEEKQFEIEMNFDFNIPICKASESPTILQYMWNTNIRCSSDQRRIFLEAMGEDIWDWKQLLHAGTNSFFPSERIDITVRYDNGDIQKPWDKYEGVRDLWYRDRVHIETCKRQITIPSFHTLEEMQLIKLVLLEY
jgi:hypothetical protein